MYSDFPRTKSRWMLAALTVSGMSKLTSIELVMPTSHLILCRPLLLLLPIPPSIRVFSNESTLHMRWPKYWSFSFSITPSKEIPRLVLINLIYWFSSSFEKVLLHYFPEAWLSQLNLSPSLIIQVFTTCIFISQIHQAHSYLHITLLLLLSWNFPLFQFKFSFIFQR